MYSEMNAIKDIFYVFELYEKADRGSKEVEHRMLDFRSPAQSPLGVDWGVVASD